MLDTATLVFVGAGSEKLSSVARAAIANEENRLFLSVISVWELHLKSATGKLPLPDAVPVYVERIRRKQEIASLMLRDEDLAPLVALPRRHCDPFDRALIAQSIARNLVIVTPDEAIRAYPEVRSIW